MPAKKTSKAEFLRSIPASLPLEEVMARAGKAGVTLSLRELSSARGPRSDERASAVTRRARSKLQGGTPKRRVAEGPRFEEMPRRSTADAEIEQRLADLVLEHGARAVEAALDAIRSRLLRLGGPR